VLWQGGRQAKGEPQIEEINLRASEWPNCHGEYTRLQDNVRKLPQLKAELLHAATLDIPPLTPLDDIHNPFIDQATSTQCKSNNSSGHLLEAFGDTILLSPVAPVKAEGESSVKRQLLPEGKKEASGPVAKKKFDFTRYSVANSPAEDSLILDPQQTTGEFGIRLLQS